MRVAIIGGGVSGIAAARVFVKSGHEAVVYERGARAGGVWAVAYPEVRLQNIAEHYRLNDVPWPFAPDHHPTREQILRYLDAAVAGLGLDVRVRHEVTAVTERDDGWDLDVTGPDGPARERFDYVVVAAGQYTGEPSRPTLADRERFAGEVITDRDVTDLARLANRRVVVVGFGKSAVDMAAFAAARGSSVQHVFRAPRWLLPMTIFGVDATDLIFARMSTSMIPSWAPPTRAERVLHARMKPLVSGFWSMIAAVVRAECGLYPYGKSAAQRARANLVTPEGPVWFQMRSALAMAPPGYFDAVIDGRIEPVRGEPAGFTETGLRLVDGREVPCDLVVLSTGFTPPRFAFLPAKYRAMLESEPDGAQLYRHLVHPRIPRMAFAGYNHGFLHIPAVEIATLWLCAVLRGDLTLPPPDEMERRIEEIRAWKREHVLFEPSRGCAINTRFHQYLDVLLGDLGLTPYRKSNALSEALVAYSARDYDGVLDEYERARGAMRRPRAPLPIST